MIGPLGRQGLAATLRQHCPQMTQRRCSWSPMLPRLFLHVKILNILQFAGLANGREHLQRRGDGGARGRRRRRRQLIPTEDAIPNLSLSTLRIVIEICKSAKGELPQPGFEPLGRWSKLLLAVLSWEGPPQRNYLQYKYCVKIYMNALV